MYVLPSFAFAASLNFLNTYQFRYYSDEYHVPLRNLNIAFLGLQLVLFVGIPVLGWITDVTQTRFGRRRPFIALFGPLLMAILFLGMYPMITSSVTILTVWFATTYALECLVTLLFLSPYQALGIELTLDSAERNRLFGATQTLYQLGVIVSTAVPEALASTVASRRKVYMLFGGASGILGCVTMLTLAFSVSEASCFVMEKRTPLIPGLIRTLANPAFGILLATITLLNCQPYFLVLLPYWVKYSLQLDSFWQAAIMTTYMTGAFVFIPFWTWLAGRIGKKRTYLLSMAVAVVAFSALLLVHSGDKIGAAIAAFAAGATGLSLNSYNFLFQSILADLIEYDALLTGYRREAQYANMVQLFNALTSVMSVSLPLFIMDAVGFKADVVQPERVQTTITLLLGPGCALFVALAAGVFTFYPITSRVHAAIRAGLDAHAAGKPADDPVTGTVVLPPAATANPVPEATAWFLDHFFRFELRWALLPIPQPYALLKLVVGWIVLSSAVTAGSVAWIVTDVNKYLEAGAFVGMVAVALLIFNLCRIGPALDFASAPIPVGVIVAHTGSG